MKRNTENVKSKMKGLMTFVMRYCFLTAKLPLVYMDCDGIFNFPPCCVGEKSMKASRYVQNVREVYMVITVLTHVRYRTLDIAVCWGGVLVLVIPVTFHHRYAPRRQKQTSPYQHWCMQMQWLQETNESKGHP